MNTPRNRWPGTSWYQDGADPGDLTRLTGRERCRIAVIGAGLAGISTGYGLIERGMEDVTVVDALEPGGGASGRNGGFVFAGYSLGNDDLIGQIGDSTAARLHGYTRDAVSLVRRRIDRLNIDCQPNDAGVLLADWFDAPGELQRYADRMRDRLGFDLQWLSRAERSQWVNSERYGGGLFEPGSFHFNPLRHIRGLADAIVGGGGRVYSRSPVTELARTNDGWRIETESGRLEADEVVLATGGYDRKLVRAVQRALQPVATYIAVTEPLGDRLKRLMPRPVAVYDTRFAFDYYRPLPDNRLLWGGRISMAARSPGAIRRLMRRDMARVFPELANAGLEHAWGGWMSYARHEMPLLGRTDDGLWYALAFGGHGMATTTLAGEVMAEALVGDEERLSEFSRWQPEWAGGMLGRVAGQGIYWRAQLKDWLHDRRSAK